MLHRFELHVEIVVPRSDDGKAALVNPSLARRVRLDDFQEFIHRFGFASVWWLPQLEQMRLVAACFRARARARAKAIGRITARCQLAIFLHTEDRRRSRFRPRVAVAA